MPPAGRRGRGGGGDPPVPAAHRPVRGAGYRLPLRRAERRERDAAPQRDERAGRAGAVAAQLLLRAGAPGRGHGGVEGRPGRGRGGAAGLRAAGAVHRRRPRRPVHRGAGQRLPAGR
jgi:hypothetical protein